ncbi:MAG TPA: DNA topoisomerase IV subunit A, partial [Parvularcula sp.]|nr:DNA topoisomerase IV subunit A [Parvularcula sp.]
LKSDEAQWKKIADELREVRKIFDPKSNVGRRRTSVEDAPAAEEINLDQLIEKEPVTVILSEKGWVRTMKGHVEDKADIKYKEGDDEGFLIKAMTTDRLMIFGTDGKFHTLGVKDLPGGRGHGEPIRLMIDLGNDQTVSAAFLYRGDRRFLVASTAGFGFIVKEEDCLSATRKGKQVLNVGDGAEACVCRPVEGELVAAVGENKKFLVFEVSELPEMSRGKGVVMQKFHDGGLSDAKTFAKKEGLTWVDRSGRIQTIDDWKSYVGKRAQSGRVAPKGFPSNRKFGAWS